MPIVSSPLLREWDLLQEQVVPALIQPKRTDRPPSVWAVDSVADAVALAAAYQHARRDGSPDLMAFASGGTRDLSPITFALSDVRCLPAGDRSAAFQRQSRAWVAGTEVAEQVILSAPRRPVDVVALRSVEADVVADRAVAQLRDGGLLLVVEGSSGIEERRGLRRMGPDGRLFCKRASQRRDLAGARGGEGGEGQLETASTLATHQAQADLVAGHARLARSLARRFSHHGESKEDLEQVALLALVKAARRYDPSRETSFSTYATASILGEIKRHFRDKTWMMRVPRSVQESYLAIKEARESLTHELSCSPTIQQISRRLGISDEAVLEAMEAGENYWPESLDVGVFEGESGREVPVEDTGFDLSLERNQLTAVLPNLAPRERVILKRLYFDGWTQRQVAEEIGVSQMQVSRLLARTIDKLRSWVAE